MCAILERLIVAMLALLVAGCGSQKPLAVPAEHAYTFLGKEPLYAALSRRANGEWTFTRISAEPPAGDDAYAVRLNDLSPAFDIRTAECEARPYRDQDRCSPLNPFRKKDVGVVDKIVSGGLAATTGGKLTGMGSYTTEFDEAAFNSAVDQALLDTGLDQHRAALIRGLQELDARVEADRAELETVQRKQWRQYQQKGRTGIEIQPHVAGLREYYSGDLDFDALVSVETNEPAEPAELAGEGAPVLPCQASDCMTALAAAGDKLQALHASRLSRLEADLRQSTSSYRVECSKTQHAGYHFELRCPDRLERKSDGVHVLPLTVIIHARDFDQLFPEFRAADDHLAIETDGGTLVMRNLTGEYVEIQSVSLYYNSQVNTTSELRDELDLAPYATANHPLSRFSSMAIDVEARYAQMTPDKASRASLTFGIAVKYSVGDRDSIATLYDKETYNVQCAIENRLRPRSCRADAALANDASGRRRARDAVERRPDD